MTDDQPQIDRDLVTDFDPARPFGSYVDVVRNLIRSPQAFFTALDPRGGYKAPVLFVLISILVPQVMLSAGLKGPLVLGMFLLTVILWPLVVGAIHVMIRAQGGQGDYRATFRATAYPSFTYLVSLAPVLGLMAQMFGLALATIGLAVVHRISLVRAAIPILAVMLAQIFLVYLARGHLMALLPPAAQ